MRCSFPTSIHGSLTIGNLKRTARKRFSTHHLFESSEDNNNFSVNFNVAPAMVVVLGQRTREPAGQAHQMQAGELAATKSEDS